MICIYKSCQKIYILKIWTISQKYIIEQDTKYILDTLIYQSLIKVEKDGIIRVHDQLKDMGRNIINKEMEY